MTIGGIVAEFQPRPLPSGQRTVSDDWTARLPEDKRDLFEGIVQHWEAGYAMLSVALNESFALRSRGELVRARQQAAVAADLAGLLTFPLAGALRTLGLHARKYGTFPRVEALNPGNFRGATGHRLAAWNSLLHGVVPAERFRFSQKLRALSAAIDEMAEEFRRSATALVEGTSTEPGTCWSELDTLHYDLNTCLRESVVVLKSFLCVLPAAEIEHLQSLLEAPLAPPTSPARQAPAPATT
jgi:hypothetical protein